MKDEDFKDHRYQCKYKIEFVPGGITGQEAAREGVGTADAVILLTLVQSPGQQVRQMMTSHNGHTGHDLETEQLWRAWYVMTAQMLNDRDLDPLKRSILMMVLGAGAAVPGNERAPSITVEQYEKKPPSDDPGDAN